ncbi:MAG TPA: hypothetical protein VIJ94_07015 [Caulobacteraceae bacterium]
MTDEMQSIRSDLAYLKGLAADDGRLPGVIGAHFLAAGLIYGLPTLLAWAIMRGVVDLPLSWIGAMGLWPTVVYIPVMILLILCTPRPKPGAATGRGVAVAWSGMGLTTGAMLATLFIAGARLHVPQTWQVWTSVCFVLWGAAWWIVAVMRRDRWWFLVSLGSLITAVINACLIGTPEELLGCGIGILLWLAGPGVVILLRSRPAA